MTKSLWLPSWKNCFTETPDVTGKAFLGELRGKKGLERLIPPHTSHVILHVVSVKGVFCKWVVGIKVCQRVRNSNTVLKEAGENTAVLLPLSAVMPQLWQRETWMAFFLTIAKVTNIERKIASWCKLAWSISADSHWWLEHTNILNEALIR